MRRQAVWGIPVPAARDLVLPDIVLVPLVGFDAACFRLGYGGGYYDRTLGYLDPRPTAIGVSPRYSSPCRSVIKVSPPGSGMVHASSGRRCEWTSMTGVAGGTAQLILRRSEPTTIVLEAGEYAIELCAIIGPVTIVGEAGAAPLLARRPRAGAGGGGAGGGLPDDVAGGRG